MILQETKLFWNVVKELRQSSEDKLSDADTLGLLDELEVIALNTRHTALAACCRAEIARFSEEAASASASASASA